MNLNLLTFLKVIDVFIVIYQEPAGSKGENLSFSGIEEN